MFTGIVETLGEVVETRTSDAGRRVVIASQLPVDAMQAGESVSVDGVCLTVVETGADRFAADVIPETLERTTLDGLAVGSRVNLERALRLGDRMDGHLVQGHVDAVAPVMERVVRGADRRLRVGLTPALSRYVARKGSVALNGVSLTVSRVEPAWFEVALIPETLRRTNLGRISRGDGLNVEVDLLARYLERLIEGGAGDG